MPFSLNWAVLESTHELIDVWAKKFVINYFVIVIAIVIIIIIIIIFSTITFIIIIIMVIVIFVVVVIFIFNGRLDPSRFLCCFFFVFGKRGLERARGVWIRKLHYTYLQSVVLILYFASYKVEVSKLGFSTFPSCDNSSKLLFYFFLTYSF